VVTKAKYSLKGKARETYLNLVIAFPLTSIKSDAHLAEAQKVLDHLLAGGLVDVGTETYLDALSDLVASYEDAHFPINPPSAAAMLSHLMEAKAISQAQLSRETAIPKSSISSVLSGRKSLSRTMVHRLAEYFGVDPSVLAVCS
jgi:HTH-type transcriptional regulator/antitoxin HigA